MELTGVAIVQLPARLSSESLTALERALRGACESEAPVVLLTGADDETFCTGMDLDTGAPIDAPAFASLLGTLADAPKPTMAFVDGRAIGGGLGLSAACDWVVASQRATFALPELLWGLVPAMIWPLVTMRLSEGLARRWTVSAHTRSAEEATAAGLVDDLAPAGREQARLRHGRKMLQRAEPLALRQLRRWARESRELPLDEALRRGAALTAQMMASPVVRSRLQAFRRGGLPWE